MFRSEVKQKIADELAAGEAARQNGFEGRARVCARRAAGAAIREYLQQRGAPANGPSAYDLLRQLQQAPETSPEIRQVCEHLLARVDEDFQLPGEIDLLAEARWLAQTLENA